MHVRRWGLLLAALAIVGAVGWTWRTTQLAESFAFKGQEYSPARPAADFTLTDQHGQPFQLSRRDADVTVMFFGYTFCPDVCPGTLAEMRQVKQLLKRKARRVQFVFVSVDPERDTPERLRDYIARFDTDFIGLTGTEAEVADVLDAYRIVAYKEPMPDSRPGYTVAHTAATFVIDQQQQIRLKMPYGIGPEAIAHDVAGLLAGWGDR